MPAQISAIRPRTARCPPANSLHRHTEPLTLPVHGHPGSHRKPLRSPPINEDEAPELLASHLMRRQPQAVAGRKPTSDIHPSVLHRENHPDIYVIDTAISQPLRSRRQRILPKVFEGSRGNEDADSQCIGIYYGCSLQRVGDCEGWRSSSGTLRSGRVSLW